MNDDTSKLDAEAEALLKRQMHQDRLDQEERVYRNGWRCFAIIVGIICSCITINIWITQVP